MKDKKGITITNAVKNFLDESNCKPIKIWVVKGSEFDKRSMKSWLQDNDREMYSTHNEGKCVAAERFIRILKTKIYKYMTSISENVYTDKAHDVNKYNNMYSTVKMKPVDVTSRTYIDLNKKNENPKFEVGNDVRISKYE